MYTIAEGLLEKEVLWDTSGLYSSLFRTQSITHYQDSIIDADRDTRNTPAYSVMYCKKIPRFTARSTRLVLQVCR
ncbi:hypothetical protein ACS0PU_006453 [Formica fusca]